MYVCVWIIWVLLFHLVLNLKKKRKGNLFRFYCICRTNCFKSQLNWDSVPFFLLCGARKSHSHDATNISNVLYHIKCILHVHIYDDLRQTNLNFLLLLPLLLLLLLLLKILNSYCYTSWGSFSFLCLIIFLAGGGIQFPFFCIGHFLSLAQFFSFGSVLLILCCCCFCCRCRRSVSSFAVFSHRKKTVYVKSNKCFSMGKITIHGQYFDKGTNKIV